MDAGTSIRTTNITIIPKAHHEHKVLMWAKNSTNMLYIEFAQGMLQEEIIPTDFIGRSIEPCIKPSPNINVQLWCYTGVSLGALPVSTLSSL